MYLYSKVAFGTTDELEFYWVETEYTNDQPYYFNTAKKWYLFKADNGNWHIYTRPSGNSAIVYGRGNDPCPTGRDDTWKYIVDGKWTTIPDFKIYGL